MTMTLISTVTVGAGGASSISWTGIPQSGTDLLILCSLRDTNGGVGINNLVRFNSDSASNYTNRYLAGNGTSTPSGSIAPASAIYASKYTGGGDTASTFGNAVIYIPNYTSSIAKSVSSDGVEENFGADSFQWINAGLWSGTAAITSVTFAPTSGFAQYSMASLYTITKGSGGVTVS